MDELKTLIEANRNLFDSAEPEVGHFERFEKKLLAQQQTKPRSFMWPTLLKVASVTILVVLSGLYLTEHFILDKMPVAQQNTEFKEAQRYYIQVVDQKIGEIETLQQTMGSEQQKMLMEQLAGMDQLYKKIQKDYQEMPNDPRIVQAMIQHYQMKVAILNRIINDLNNVKQTNSSDHESIEL